MKQTRTSLLALIVGSLHATMNGGAPVAPAKKGAAKKGAAKKAAPAKKAAKKAAPAKKAKARR